MKKTIVKSFALAAISAASLLAFSATAQTSAQNTQPPTPYTYPITSYAGERYPLVNPAMPEYDKAVWNNSNGPRPVVGRAGLAGERYPLVSPLVPAYDKPLWVNSGGGSPSRGSW